jgi:B12-binding domain/radical SAM domain protein
MSKENQEEKPFLLFRKTWGNRYTIPVLLGCIEESGLSENFQIILVHSVEELRQKVVAKKGIVAFSFMTPNFGQVKEELAQLRCLGGKRLTFIAGGPHPTGDPEGTLRIGFDFVFSGEAEDTLLNFLREYLQGKFPREHILTAKGKPELFPSFLPNSLDHRFFAPMEVTRGCLYNCAFCQTPRIFGHTLRHRTTENATRALRRLILVGNSHTAFISSNAFSYGAIRPQNPNLAAIEELLAACRETGIEQIHFGCYPSEVRPDWVTPEVLALVKKYCRNKTIVLGAQSGSDPQLLELKRGHTAEQALLACQWIRQAGFMPHVDFVFGFPGERKEDRNLSLHLMAKMILEQRSKIHAHTFMPLPGTPLFQKDPAVLDPETKNTLKKWEEKKKLDGWWEEQEAIAWKIVEWRDQGLIRSSPGIKEISELSKDR